MRLRLSLAALLTALLLALGAAQAATWDTVRSDSWAAAVARVTSFVHGAIPYGTSGTDGVSLLAPGTDGQALTSDSTTVSGLAWDTVGGFTVGFGALSATAAPVASTSLGPIGVTAFGEHYVALDAAGNPNEFCAAFFFLPASYDSTANLTLKVRWAASGAGAGSRACLTVAFATMTGVDLDTDTVISHLATAVTDTAGTTVPATLGTWATTTFTISNANLDAAAAGDRMLIVVSRDGNDQDNDDSASEVYVLSVEGYQ